MDQADDPQAPADGGLYLPGGYVAALRGHLARADELLQQAKPGDPQFADLMRERDNVLGVMAGYLAAALDAAEAARDRR